MRIYLEEAQFLRLLQEAEKQSPGNAAKIRAIYYQGFRPQQILTAPQLTQFNRVLQEYAKRTGLPELQAAPHLVNAQTLRTTRLYHLIKQGARCCTIQEYLQKTTR